MKEKKNYIIILIYSLLLIFLLLGIKNFYGSTIDWNLQHSIIPNYFRDLFYETKTLIPNLEFNIGAGQNIFNFSYYGLMSPIILLSYLLPFISMKVYIMLASIILFILSGLLFYKFLLHHTSEKISLYLSIIFLTLAPLTFHFHFHIMFVWYMPFLILALMGVDKYIEQNKSYLLIFSIFIVLLINYYYGVTSILVIVIYGIYRLLSKYDNLKNFGLNLLKSSLRVITPILLSCFIILPTAYVILHTGRIDEISMTIKELLIFDFREIFYKSYSPGISMLFIISLFSIFAYKSDKKDKFLNIILLLISLIPLFMYVLNGFLYIRGKVLIPFIPLYFIGLSNFINKLMKKEIDFKKLIFIILIFLIYIFITNSEIEYFYLLVIDLLISSLSIFIYKKFNKLEILFIPLYIIILISSIVQNSYSEYLSIDKFKEENKYHQEITELLNNLSDDIYRSDANINEENNMNKVFNNNYYSTSMYSSSYNNLYHNFYNNNFSNNIPHRNVFIISGTNNPLFHTLMGVKYIINKDIDLLNYKKINNTNNYNLYENDNVYPIIYGTSEYGYIKYYDNLEYPYNLEYMLKYPVTNSSNNIKFNSLIKEINVDKDSYEFKLDKKQEYNYKLPEVIDNEYLIIKFDMDYNESCINGDQVITINGVKNKLTCRSWQYNNHNKNFEYVISSNNIFDTLNIEITKGKYKISNIKMYIMPNLKVEYNELNNLKIDKAKSIINGDINLNKDGYIITTLPYDEGFKVYVDNQKVDFEIVNTAFLGFKVKSGKHNIKIVYNSPWYNYGVILSILGLLLSCGIMFSFLWHILSKRKNVL